MEDKTAPRKGCPCTVCTWANTKLDAQRALDADLAANYERYLAGDLVSREERE